MCVEASWDLILTISRIGILVSKIPVRYLKWHPEKINEGLLIAESMQRISLDYLPLWYIPCLSKVSMEDWRGSKADNFDGFFTDAPREMEQPDRS